MSLIWVNKATAAARAALPIPISVCSIKYKVACMCFSAINGSGPAYLSELLLHVYNPSRTLRSSSDTRMLEIQQYKRKTYGFRTFSCLGPHIWNSLPQALVSGSGPAYLSELLHVYTPSRTLRSSSDTRMLEIQQYKRKTHGFRTFSCFGPHVWNSLPQDLRHCSTLSSFKAKLKTFLFSQYFHPN